MTRLPASLPEASHSSNQHVAVAHRRLGLGQLDVFYREAGPPDAPTLLLPHGYPCSSYQFRQLMPALADRWHLLAPDFPGFGYTSTPSPGAFNYTFDGYAEWLHRFCRALDIDRYSLYLHDYGSQIGLRLAMKNPARIAGLIIQNGDIYEDALGPKYAALQSYWAHPTPAGRATLAEAVSEAGFREEFLNDVPDHIVPRLSPDLWTLAWKLLSSPQRREVSLALMEGLKQNVAWFLSCQAYLREHQPPTLIVWGPCDGYMPEPSARAYLRDLPQAELHLIEDGGHWLLETHLEQVVPLIRRFLGTIDSGGTSPRAD